MSSHDEVVRHLAGQIMELADALVEPLAKISDSVAAMAVDLDKASIKSNSDDAKEALKFLIMTQTEIKDARAYLDRTREYAKPVSLSYPYT